MYFSFVWCSLVSQLQSDELKSVAKELAVMNEARFVERKSIIKKIYFTEILSYTE